MPHYWVRCVFVISFQHLEDVDKTIDYIFFVFRLSSLVVRAWKWPHTVREGDTRGKRDRRESPSRASFFLAYFFLAPATQAID